MAPVTGVPFDSSNVSEGSLFFCVPGAKVDGHEFAPSAAAAGAAALCVERPLETNPQLPQIVVHDVRKSMPLVGAAVYGHPSRSLTLLGVTGTNGKTTTAYLLDSILKADARTTGLIGTIETRIGDEHRRGTRTTPESLDLQRLLWEMVEAVSRPWRWR